MSVQAENRLTCRMPEVNDESSNRDDERNKVEPVWSVVLQILLGGL